MQDKEILKTISVKVNEECWRKLKICSIQRGTTFAKVVKEILERSMSKKMFEEIKIEE